MVRLYAENRVGSARVTSDSAFMLWRAHLREPSSDSEPAAPPGLGLTRKGPLGTVITADGVMDRNGPQHRWPGKSRCAATTKRQREFRYLIMSRADR
jgi:hypothetical protein